MKGGESVFIDKKSKSSVLMLHGFSSTPDQFKELALFLAEKGFNVYAPLIAGHGTSPDDLLKTKPDDWKKSVKDAYLKLKKISPKIFLIGNSFGANLAFWLAKEFNNEPSGIISLGAPIYLKYHKFILCRLYSYGLIQKYYRKPPRIYKTDYIDFDDEVTYPIIPTKSLRDFLEFIKTETIPNLSKISSPILVGHAKVDNVVNPKSATYIYENVRSQLKRIYWFPGRAHVIIQHEKKEELLERIYSFLKEIS